MNCSGQKEAQESGKKYFSKKSHLDSSYSRGDRDPGVWDVVKILILMNLWMWYILCTKCWNPESELLNVCYLSTFLSLELKHIRWPEHWASYFWCSASSMVFNARWYSSFQWSESIYLLKVSSCKACTSDGGSDPGCEEEPELEPSTECTAQYGNDFCYVLVTKDFQADGILRWNSE